MRYLEVDGEPLTDDEIDHINNGGCINCGNPPEEIEARYKKNRKGELREIPDMRLIVVAKLRTGTIWWHKVCKKFRNHQLSPTETIEF